MIVVLFEALPHAERRQDYVDAATELLPHLKSVDGFLAIERFESLTAPGKFLSLSFWRDEEAIRRWRTFEPHQCVQRKGRQEIFADYRLRVATIVRDYSLEDRREAPTDSRRMQPSRS